MNLDCNTYFGSKPMSFIVSNRGMQPVAKGLQVLQPNQIKNEENEQIIQLLVPKRIRNR
ncbi:46232_t:CDS:1, partial [Gigaspora margarita]